MKNQTPPILAVSAVVLDEDSVLLVRRGREPNLGLWSFPGGRVEPGEMVREALEREIVEETSLRVSVGDLVDVQDIVISTNGETEMHYVVVVFSARVVSGTLRAASDAAEARWVPLEQVSTLPVTAGLLERLHKAVCRQSAMDA